MAKRTSLVDMHRIVEKAAGEVSTPTAAQAPDNEMVTTAVHLPRRSLALLRRVAVERANRYGGRPSVSALITEIIESQRGKLEAEIK